jgi:hypothetical protein
LTVWLIVPVLVVKLPSPEYIAVMECGPTASVVILAEIALPPDSATGEPKLTPSILNCTVPVGVPDPGALAVAVAVNVTLWPKTDGLADVLMAVAVVSWLTTCVRAGDDVLVRKLLSPLYTAVILCEPAARDDVVRVAWPARLTVPVPIVLLPSLNVTIPDAVPAPGAVAATVAVNVTLWPNTEGLAEEVSDVLVPALLTVCVRVVAVFPLKLLSPM